MSKLPVAVLVTILVIQTSGAQILKSFGVKVAYTSANQTFPHSWYTESYEFNRRSGFDGAVFAEWLNVPYFSLITQVEYAQRGTRNTFLWPNNEPAPLRYVTVDNRLDYLSVLPLLKFTVPLPIVRPYIFAGPRFDMLLGFKSTLGWYGYDDLYNSFKKRTFGASLGLGVELAHVLPVVVFVEGRYDADLANASSSPSNTYRNNAYDICLGVAI